MKQLLIFGIAVAMACAAYAYPTLSGPTGLATLPTAAVAPAGDFQVALDYYDTEGDAVLPIRLLYGVSDNFEINAAFITGDGLLFGVAEEDGTFNISNDNTWAIGAKYLTPLTIADFAWAITGQYASSSAEWTSVTVDGETLTAEEYQEIVFDLFGEEFDISDIDATIWALGFVGSRTLLENDSLTLNGTVGINWTNRDFDATVTFTDGEVTETDEVSEEDDAIRLFGGLEAAFVNNLTLGIELQSEGDDIEEDMLWSLFARYPVIENLTVQAGFTNSVIGLPIAGDDSNFFLGATYAFGMGAE